MSGELKIIVYYMHHLPFCYPTNLLSPFFLSNSNETAVITSHPDINVDNLDIIKATYTQADKVKTIQTDILYALILFACADKQRHTRI